MEYKRDIEESFEEKQNGSNIDRLLYLKQQKDIVERSRQAIDKFKQIAQFQKKVNTLYYEKWKKIDSSVESLQEDIDWYVKRYIMPIQERQQELDELKNSLISSIPEKQNILGKIGRFFERFIPGITKEGRQRIKIEDKKQTLEGEIETYSLMIEGNPFEILEANKDIKGQLLEKIDISKLDEYSTMQNDPKNYLKSNSSVKSIADSIKEEDMTSILDSYPALEEESNYLISEMIHNGLEAFNRMVSQIANNSIQMKNELIPQINFKTQEDSDKDILLDMITQQMQSLMDNLTSEELDEIKKRDLQNTLASELEDNEQ